MGWCHEFGSQIREGCDHPMVAGGAACGCAVCGVSCPGRFAGCATVWASGPREISLVRPQPSGRRARPGATGPGTDDRASRPDAPTRAGVPASGSASSPRTVNGNGHPADARGGEVGVDDGRAEILEWLRTAFDGVRSDIRMLADTVGRQQATLATFEEAASASAQIVAATQELPARVAAAVAESLDGHERKSEPAREAVVVAVSDSLSGIESIAGDLRNELVRLTAFREALSSDLPAVAKAVDDASARAEARLSELTERVDELAARKGLTGLVRGLTGQTRTDA